MVARVVPWRSTRRDSSSVVKARWVVDRDQPSRAAISRGAAAPSCRNSSSTRSSLLGSTSAPGRGSGGSRTSSPISGGGPSSMASHNSWPTRLRQGTAAPCDRPKFASSIAGCSPRRACGRLKNCSHEPRAIALHDWLFERWIDPVRSDPRFKKFLETIRATEAHARAQAWRATHPPEDPAAK